MGRMVEQEALRRGHEITARIDLGTEDNFDSEGFAAADMVIEFSTPKSAPGNITEALRRGKPVVSGSTGWNSGRWQVEAECSSEGGRMLVSSNFSLGMNLMMDLNRRLAAMMSVAGGYEPRLSETHHIHKLDHPSGTAVTLAEDLIAGYAPKKQWKEAILPDEDTLGVTVVREGEVCGIHEVAWVSDADRISIRHEAFNRSGFALGAVVAAEWLAERGPGIYAMEDVMRSLFG